MAIPLPSVPILSGFTLLSVFVHPDAPVNETSHAIDGPRFRALGQRTLLAAYTAAIARVRSDLSGVQLQEHIYQNYPMFLQHWVNAYGWRLMTTGVPEGVDVNTPEETRRIFETYAGAVAVQYGFDCLYQWILTLV